MFIVHINGENREKSRKKSDFSPDIRIFCPFNQKGPSFSDQESGTSLRAEKRFRLRSDSHADDPGISGPRSLRIAADSI
ncbi:hypothetical protein EVA_13093 [gut metagenome]|uniref:Uncharacterized protein n=1 Tax=gut metagenome TaxID=749906 RepID=J9FUZ0_9ZZZZ